MNWQTWADQLRQTPQQAVGDLLRGAADIGTFERAAPFEFLLAILPRGSRMLSRRLLGEPNTGHDVPETTADLPEHLDAGLAAWLRTQRAAPPPPPRKLAAYAAQVSEALQWPLYFPLPQTRAALRSERTRWLQWLGTLTLSAFRDPEYDYWQVLAARQEDDRLQVFWQAFVSEAGRTRSLRYLDLGLLALARLPLSDDDSLRNLRLQVQTLVNRYQQRKTWGVPAQEALAEQLRGVMARNPSLSAANYRVFLTDLLAPLGDDRTVSVLSLLGLRQAPTSLHRGAAVPAGTYRLEPPGSAEETDRAVSAVRNASSLEQAWNAIRLLLSDHEAFLHRTGDAYYFVRTLDMCARALCNRYTLLAGPIQDRLFQWIQLALQMDGDDPRLWMLWELALRKSGHPQRAQWVLWEMTRRFPDNLPCRVELARLLAVSGDPAEQDQAQRLLRQVLRLDQDNRHAYSTLAQLAIQAGHWTQALAHAQRGLQIDPSDEPSALLLATAYARRGDPGDLDTAIDHLQRFTTHYRGQLKAEDYLRKLQQRRQSMSPAEGPQDWSGDQPSSSPDATAELDLAWRAFAESIRRWQVNDQTPAAAGADPAVVDRVLPLPEALRQAAARGDWTDDVLDRYDTAVRQEFPLEVRLWHYLGALHTDTTGESERDRARQDVEHWLAAEQKAPSYDSPTWIPFLTQTWQSMAESAEAAKTRGGEWLKDLLDRYQPLPAPLFE